MNSDIDNIEEQGNEIHYSLLYPMTMGGIDKRLAALLIMFSGILYIIFQSVVIFVPVIVLYVVLRIFYKKDYFILDVYKQYISLKKRYYK